MQINSRNLAIVVLLILTLVLGVVSLIIASRIGTQSPDVSVDECGEKTPEGCCIGKGETFCNATNQCHEPGKPCSTTDGGNTGGDTCKTNYAGGCVTRTSACSSGITCTRYTGPNDSATCSENNQGTFTVAPGQTVCVSPSCKQCEQIDCTDGGGQRRNNDSQCSTPVPPPPATPKVCGDNCTATSQCPTGNSCTGGKCVRNGCTPETCTNGCVPITAEPPVCGDACTSDAQCPTGNTCTNGLCTLAGCTPETCTAGCTPICGGPCTPGSTVCPNGMSCDPTSNRCSLTSCVGNNACTNNGCTLPLPETAVISDNADPIIFGILFIILGLFSIRILDKMFLFTDAAGEMPRYFNIFKRNLQIESTRRGRDKFEEKVESQMEDKI